jgi:SHS2 domain-containing protein
LRFEILEHPADIGFRALGRTIAELFENAAEAMAWIALELDDISGQHEYPVSASGADSELLLVNWLSEILYLVDGRRLALRQFRVDEIDSVQVRGAALGEPRDPARHRAKLIVKAVTYHQLKVAQTPDGWCAEVYLDI